MAKSIATNPAKGDIYECIFGHFMPENPEHPEGPFKKDDYNFRIPNEIRKRRPVVILGVRKTQIIVVPISTREDRASKPHKKAEAQGVHVKIPAGSIPVTDFYSADTVCWAKADLIQTVDIQRLREFPNKNKTHTKGKVCPDTLKLIEEAVLRSIGCMGKIRIPQKGTLISATPDKVETTID